MQKQECTSSCSDKFDSIFYLINIFDFSAQLKHLTKQLTTWWRQNGPPLIRLTYPSVTVAPESLGEDTARLFSLHKSVRL